jgi:hypothetical protein
MLDSKKKKHFYLRESKDTAFFMQARYGVGAFGRAFYSFKERTPGFVFFYKYSQ